MKAAGAIGFGVLVGAATAVMVGSLAWRRGTARAVARLGGAARHMLGAERGNADRFTSEQLVGLPAPVARYFEFALTPGQPLVRSAEIQHAGEFAMRPGAWSPFTSVEHFVVYPPGFVWDATVRVGSLLPIRVRDAYASGEGMLRAAVGGLVPVADQHGTPEMAAGALLRYLAEAVWSPTALLPSAGVQWQPVDDRTARAMLTDGGTTVSMEVHFAPGGEVTEVTAERYRTVGDTAVLTPWVGRFADYTRLQGMMIPITGDVAWRLSSGPFSYWRAHILRAEYGFAGASEP